MNGEVESGLRVAADLEGRSHGTVELKGERAYKCMGAGEMNLSAYALCAHAPEAVVRVPRLELGAFRLGGGCSIHLSYTRLG
jgi:hypothetical protein